jgi:hypothetical protein
MKTHPYLFLFLGCGGLAAMFASAVAADQPDAKNVGEVHFNRDIRPILSNRCFKCHGPDLKKGGLNLQDRTGAVKELKSGRVAVVPGKSAESELVRRITSDDPSERMPPVSEPLSAEQIAKLKSWIDQGAKYEEHWAYVKPVRPALPAVRNKNWPKNGIDYFVLARLEQEGLSPSPEAERATLIRRVSLDVTGLPPSVAEVDAFLADQSENAYEKVVDRLLGSVHYGEHQARPWLDMARYADTNGYEKDERRTIWPYRDWLINAFNRDVPFDQFTIEQIAGDLLPNATQEQQIATGFHRNTMVNTEGGTDKEEFRVAAVVDRVNTTMEVWMGTTMGCCQCHNHKYDPFTQKEFYQLFAFFNGTTDHGGSNEPTLAMPTEQETKRRQKVGRDIALVQLGWLMANPLARVAQARSDQARLAELKKQSDAIKPASTLVMRELDKPRPTFVQIRGNHTKKGDPVSPGVPAKLHPLNRAPSRIGAPTVREGGTGLSRSLTVGAPMQVGVPMPNRLDLGRWLVDPDNPLVGRVTVNRIWARYFGRGFVETSEDFGVQGDLPTHPQLLDWLAVEFVKRKWSVKAMHKLIVMSATYRQSSRVTPELVQRDPFNHLFAHGPRFRLDAEMVRDNALAISGLLCRKVGGPSVFPYQPEGVWFNPYSTDKWEMSKNGDQHRRGLYTFWRRTAPYAAFMAFDAPSREVCAERRPRTNTPLQALATLNDKAFVECAAALARRMMTEARDGERERAIHGFRMCVARMPTQKELDYLLALFRENLEKYRKDAAAAKAMATNAGTIPNGMDVAELVAWTVVANVLLNLDETITKS